jgi:hypothetical protein
LAHRKFVSLATDETVLEPAPCRLLAMKAKDIVTAVADLALLMATKRQLR